MKYSKQDCQRRINALRMEQQKYVPAYRELSDYINPMRGLFNNDRTKIGKTIDHQKLISSFATHALRIFASGLNSGMTNKSSTWFKLTVSDSYILGLDGMKQWLDSTEKKMYRTINSSNIYESFYSCYEELGQFGTGCFLILEDFDEVFRARSFTAGEYYIATDSKGRVNTFGRDFQLTVDQLVDQFGYESCSPVVQGYYDNKQLENKIDVCHLIEPNRARIPGIVDKENMEYISFYWEAGRNEDKFLDKRGFDYFPVIAPRWETISTDSDYGYGPGWHALGSIKELQKTRKDKLLSQEKIHNPPTLKDSSVIGHTNLMPGGSTVVSGNTPNSGVRPAYQINPNLESFLQLLEEEKEEIDRFFYVNMFLMLANIDKSGITATEVAAREQEKLLMMGPALNKMDEEMLTPALEAIFYIMFKNGLIDPLPESVTELGIDAVDIKIKYTSLLAQAQSSAGVSKIEKVFSFAGMFAQAFPDILDVLDYDFAIRDIADMEGAPSSIVRHPDVVDKIRQDRIDQQNRMVAMQAAETGAKATKDLATAPVGSGSALDGIMNTIGGK